MNKSEIRDYLRGKREAPMLEDIAKRVLYPGRVFPVRSAPL